MTSADDQTSLEMVVGLEVHVQLKTATKIFCNCSADFGAPPNVNTCPVCLALPGALPVLNGHAVSLAMRTALALGCEIHEHSVFARKNYFYPDLPKGYQISQFDRPLATSGRVVATRQDGTSYEIRITRVHMEEDAGKSVHDRFPGLTAVDLNRAGVPLVEIVSEPDIRSAGEASGYLRELKQILEYTRVSDVNMEEGSLRVDANISVRRRGVSLLGTKTEIKNLNSFSAVARALDVEFARQCAVLDGGGAVEQQTMLWDDRTGTVRPARSKEGSHDYRYFPDPDLPPLTIPREHIARARAELPELPTARRARYRRAYGDLTQYDIEVLTASPAIGKYFEEVVAAGRRGGDSGDAKHAANWVLGEVLATLKERGEAIDRLAARPAHVAQLLDMVRDGRLSTSAAKLVFAIMADGGGAPAGIAVRERLLKVTDDAALTAWIDDVLRDFPAEAQRFVGGERRLQGVLVGHVMKRSNGSADPTRVNQLLAERIGSKIG